MGKMRKWMVGVLVPVALLGIPRIALGGDGGWLPGLPKPATAAKVAAPASGSPATGGAVCAQGGASAAALVPTAPVTPLQPWDRVVLGAGGETGARSAFPLLSDSRHPGVAALGGSDKEGATREVPNAGLKLHHTAILGEWYPLADSDLRFSTGATVPGGKRGGGAARSRGAATPPLSGNFIEEGPAVAPGSGFNPYLGLGWGRKNQREKGWGVTLDAGVAYEGASDLVTDRPCGGGLSDAACQRFRSEVGREGHGGGGAGMEGSRWSPVVGIGMAYRF